MIKEKCPTIQFDVSGFLSFFFIPMSQTVSQMEVALAFFTPIKLVECVLAFVHVITCIKWRRLIAQTLKSDAYIYSHLKTKNVEAGLQLAIMRFIEILTLDALL